MINSDHFRSHEKEYLFVILKVPSREQDYTQRSFKSWPRIIRNREGRYKLHLAIKNSFSIAIESAEDIEGDQHPVKALV